MNPDEPFVRPAGPDDVDEMLAIYAPLVTDSIITFEEEVPSAEEFRQRIEANHLWLVAELDGSVAGYAYAAPFHKRASYRWSIELSVYVHPDFHRRGAARALIGRLIDDATAKGYVNAFAGVALPNDSSVALF